MKYLLILTILLSGCVTQESVLHSGDAGDDDLGWANTDDVMRDMAKWSAQFKIKKGER